MIVPIALLGAAGGASASDYKPTADGPRLKARLLSRDRDLTNAEYTAVERRLIGSTAGAVGLLLGKPDSCHSRGDGTTCWSYSFGRGHNTQLGYVSVFVRDGRVVMMAHNERQTGVREDDLVGCIGP